jgi:1-acyl-sn-glycerol-3-phosphate acyltransferase
MPRTEVLKFSHMALRRGGTPAQRLVQLLISLALRLFFRRIETFGAGDVPTEEPLLFVINHPNGLIDPALVFCALPRRVSFLAKSTLFNLPILGRLLRLVEALPVYRRSDAPADVSLNRRTFALSRALLRRNRCIAIFPEGRSHNEPQLQPVKTGAARIALGAVSINSDDEPDGVETKNAREGLEERRVRDLHSLKIIPVGLYYTSKTSFRSEALIRFGPPLEVFPVALDEDGEPPRDVVRELSARIETALRDVTLNVADDEELETVARAEQLFSSIYETINFRLPLSAEFELRQRFADALALKQSNESRRASRLRERLSRFENALSEFGVRPENLAVLAHSRSEVLRHFVVRWLAVLVFSPLALFGALLHLPAYLVATFVSRRFRRHGIDEIAPTVKIIAAIILVPATWLLFALAIYLWLGWRVALASLPVSILCGYVAVRTLETLYDLRGWFRALLTLARDRRKFLRLLIERRALHREMRALASDTAQARP